jgi:putative flippase GtrA
MIRMLRFGLVGFAGAAVHMGGFWLAQQFLGLGNSTAWSLSFLAAATSTWFMNRRFTFQDRARANQRDEWLGYLAVAAFGAGAHFLTFHGAIRLIPFFAQHPALAIIPGSLASFVVTYSGASAFVFRKARKSP